VRPAAATSATAPGAPTPRSRAAATNSPRVAVLLLGALAVVWGVHWVVAKKGLDYMPPFTYAALRVAAGLATVLVIAGARRQLARPSRHDLPILLSVALGQVAAGTVLMNVALQVVPAGRSAILVYTMPIWVVVLQAVIFRVRPLGWELAGLVLGLAGIVALMNPFGVDWGAPGEVAGAALLLLSAAIWAATSIHVRRHRWTATPLALQPWQLLVAVIPLSVLAILVERGAAIRWEPATLMVLLYSGPLATAFAFWASQSITRSLGPLAATVGFLGVPVVGVAAGAVLLGEQLTPFDLGGFVLVAAGILLVTRPASAVRAPGAGFDVPPAPGTLR
jgi:drug/metabolite transporter (DMT)-like permease